MTMKVVPYYKVYTAEQFAAFDDPWGLDWTEKESGVSRSYLDTLLWVRPEEGTTDFEGGLRIVSNNQNPIAYVYGSPDLRVLPYNITIWEFEGQMYALACEVDEM